MDLNDLQEDEFFGNDGEDEPEQGLTQRDDLADRERRARGQELHTIAYFDAYDAHKEERLQEGFEIGYKETIDVAKRIGSELGKQLAAAKLLSSKSDEDGTIEVAKQSASQVFEFLKDFEQRAGDDGIPEELENLQQELKAKTIHKE